MITVLVVDDEILIRAGLAALIRAAPGLEVAGEAADGRQAVQMAESTHPDVVLMDVRMPNMNGVTATERILGQSSPDSPRVLILTVHDLDEYVYSALRAGASGFLLKDTPPDRLLAAIHTVAAGDAMFAPSVTRRLIEAYIGRPSPQPPPALDPLTTREVEVLRLVGTGLSNPEIGGRLAISESTVKTHLNRAMAKLGLRSRAQAVICAYETGLCGVTQGATDLPPPSFT